MMDPSSETMNLSIQFIILFVLTLLNGICSCAEIALVSADRVKLELLEEEGNKQAKKVLAMVREPNYFLSSIQICITLAGFFSSASAATGLSGNFGTWLSYLGLPYGRTIAFFSITLILSFVTLVIGELVPKRLGMIAPEKISMLLIDFVKLIVWLSKPFAKLLSLTTEMVLRVFGIKGSGRQEIISEEEIMALVRSGRETGVFDEYEREMIESIFEFDDKFAEEIMTSRRDVYAIDIDQPLSTYLVDLLKSRHSRIPVFEGDIDNIIGILYIKDLFMEIYKQGMEAVDIKKILKKPFFVPETKMIVDLFHDMQNNKKYMAVLIDEYGGFSGIVTMEDLVEEVMGPIDDIGDKEEPKLEQITSDMYILDGLMPIDEVNELVGANFSNEDHDTISGLILDVLGYIPENDDYLEVMIDNFKFKILSIKDKRIEKVRMVVQEVEEEETKL